MELTTHQRYIQRFAELGMINDGDGRAVVLNFSVTILDLSFIVSLYFSKRMNSVLRTWTLPNPASSELLAVEKSAAQRREACAACAAVMDRRAEGFIAAG